MDFSALNIFGDWNFQLTLSPFNLSSKLEGQRRVRCRRMKRCMFLLNPGQLSCLKNVFSLFRQDHRETKGNKHSRGQSNVLRQLFQALIAANCNSNSRPLQMALFKFYFIFFFNWPHAKLSVCFLSSSKPNYFEIFFFAQPCQY